MYGERGEGTFCPPPVKLAERKKWRFWKKVMQQFGPYTKFGPETDSDRRQIPPKTLITSNLVLFKILYEASMLHQLKM